MTNRATDSMRPWARDTPLRSEVIQRNNQPTGRMEAPYRAAAATMKGPTRSHVPADGINDLIPPTNSTQAPDQWGRS